jgi:hypothetical protein
LKMEAKLFPKCERPLERLLDSDQRDVWTSF